MQNYSTGEQKSEKLPQVLLDAGEAKLVVGPRASLKIWSLLAKIHDNEWSGTIFFRLLKGSPADPKGIEIEVIDFFLMDLGTHTFTSFKWTEEIAGYQMDNPELMEEGVRVGCLHSHHTMRTFFSSEDIDDLVINTRDDNTDFYLSMIVNVDGDWIARVAFRMEASEKKKVKSTFTSKLMKGFKSVETEETANYQALCMVPLKVVQEGYDRIDARIAELETAKRTSTYDHISKAVPYTDPRYPYGGLSNTAGQTRLFEGLEELQSKAREEQEDWDEAYDAFQGSLLMGAINFDDGLDKAVEIFHRRCTDSIDNPLNMLIAQWSEQIIAKAPIVVAMTEGKQMPEDYIAGCVQELIESLELDFVDGPYSAEQILVSNLKIALSEKRYDWELDNVIE